MKLIDITSTQFYKTCILIPKPPESLPPKTPLKQTRLRQLGFSLNS